MSTERIAALGHRPAVLRLCSSVAAAVATWAIRLGDGMLLWRERHRQRRALAGLSDHVLKDLGLSRCDAGQESGKRFWQN
jgi:uncharacterized protein YjiS (DUF1127 family)